MKYNYIAHDVGKIAKCLEWVLDHAIHIKSKDYRAYVEKVNQAVRVLRMVQRGIPTPDLQTDCDSIQAVLLEADKLQTIVRARCVSALRTVHAAHAQRRFPPPYPPLLTIAPSLFYDCSNVEDEALSFTARILTREEQWEIIRSSFMAARTTDDFHKATRIAFMFSMGPAVGARSEDLGGLAYCFLKLMEPAPSSPIAMPVCNCWHLMLCTNGVPLSYANADILTLGALQALAMAMKGGKTVQNMLTVWSGAVVHVNPLMCPLGYTCDLLVGDIRLGGCKILHMLAKVGGLTTLLVQLHALLVLNTQLLFACRGTRTGQSYACCH